MKIGADDRLFVTDIAAGGIGVLARDGEIEALIPVGKAPTNCCFDGERLWVTDAGVLADSTEPSSAGQLWRVYLPGGGPKAHLGYIDVPRAAESDPRKILWW
jgi:gluconolactonase